MIMFLTELFEQGLSYSAINTARSAIISLVSICTDSNALTSSILLQKFMKGVFTSRPTFPKYNVTWDVGVLLRYLERLSPPKALNLFSLSAKLMTLMLLLSGQRGQSIHLLKVSDVECNEKELLIRFNHSLKHSRPGTHLDEIVLPCYTHVGLCVVSTFQEYIKRTKAIRATDIENLFLTVNKPHRPISRDTASRWVKRTMKLAGINLSMFAPHSVRAASTSAAFAANVPIQTILKTAGWTQDSTFRKYYNKPVRRSDQFAQSILDKAH